MNAIAQETKGDEGSVYGATDMILCGHPDCFEIFREKGRKKYHSQECKNSHHKLERIAGQKVLARGKIRAALIAGMQAKIEWQFGEVKDERCAIKVTTPDGEVEDIEDVEFTVVF